MYEGWLPGQTIIRPSEMILNAFDQRGFITFMVSGMDVLMGILVQDQDIGIFINNIEWLSFRG